MFLYNSLLWLDHSIFKFINGFAFKWVWLDMLGIFLSKYLIYLGAIILILFLLRFQKNWKMVVIALASGLVARFLITDAIRTLRPRLRPFNINDINLLIDRVNQNSFPSGHASFGFAVATVVYLWNKKWGLVFFGAAVLISIARVFAGVHWPADIIAGAGVGIFSGWLINKLIKKYGRI